MLHFGGKGRPSELPRQTSAEEHQLLLGVAQGESQAWRRLFERYGDLIYSCIYHTLRRLCSSATSDDAKDATQDLFLALMANDGKKLRSFEGRNGCSLASWLHTVAARHTIGFLRKRRHPHVSTEDVPEDEIVKQAGRDGGQASSTVRGEIEKREELERLAELVSQLPERERLVFSLYYWDEQTHDEIADLLGVTPNNVDQILYRIRKHLKELATESPEPA